MKSKKSPMNLGRRERQIMAYVYRQGEATAADVKEGIDEAPGYSAVRAMLRILEEKGFLTHRTDGNRYVYRPTMSPEEAGRSAMRYTLGAFFDGRIEQAVAALLDVQVNDLSDDELDRLTEVIERARREGR